MEQIDNEAHEAALKIVANMLQRPGQLEKIEQYKRRISHKKASVEAQLKSAMQSQLDGVRVGLKQLHECLDDIKDVSNKLDSLETSLTAVAPLCGSLQAVREENMRHSQYVTAMDSLKHIFTVPESVEKTKQWISEGKLLHAHQCLTDLENSRDDLFFEIHKLPNQSHHDMMLLRNYFEEVETLSNLLDKQIRLILGRTLNTVRKEPTVIVTALRLIEREEKRDQQLLQQKKQTGFIPDGRPKRWRQKAFEVLELSVATRIEGTRVDEREDNKMWLVRYLELIRQLILEDLRVVKTLCVPCFPPHYDIVNKYVEMYHTCLSNTLQEIIQNGIEGNEYVTLLSWILNTYPGPELMANPELNIDLSHLEPLLSDTLLTEMQDQYLQRMEKNCTEWMEKTLQSEQAEWASGGPPEQEPHTSAYHTHAPIIVFQMIDQNLQVTTTISKQLTFKALLMSIDQVTRYGQMYREAIIQFKNKHFKDRSQSPYFTQHVITIVNNCQQMQELARQTERRYWPRGEHHAGADAKVEALLNTFENLRTESVKYLLEEAFLDLESHFEDLFTNKWLLSTIPMDTILVTLEDYFQDYNHLTPKNFEFVITEAQNLVCKRYITAMLSKRLTLKTIDESQSAAAKIIKEANQIKSFFTKIAPENNNLESSIEIIHMLSEVLKCEDIDMLSLDLHKLLEKCPDINEDHLIRLLSIRGDLPKSDIKERVSYIVGSSKGTKSTQAKGIFSHIIFSDRLLSHFTL